MTGENLISSFYRLMFSVRAIGTAEWRDFAVGFGSCLDLDKNWNFWNPAEMMTEISKEEKRCSSGSGQRYDMLLQQSLKHHLAALTARHWSSLLLPQLVSRPKEESPARSDTLSQFYQD